MRDAETILAIIRDRGTRGLPLEDVYRQLFNPALYQAAYRKLARNQGAMTPGVTSETVDGMSQDRIQAIIDAIRLERIDGSQRSASTSRRNTRPRSARWDYPPGRTRCCKK